MIFIQLDCAFARGPLLCCSISILFLLRGGSDAFNLNNLGSLRAFVVKRSWLPTEYSHVLTTLVLEAHSNLCLLLLLELIELKMRKGHSKCEAFSTCINGMCNTRGEETLDVNNNKKADNQRIAE